MVGSFGIGSVDIDWFLFHIYKRIWIRILLGLDL